MRTQWPRRTAAFYAAMATFHWGDLSCNDPGWVYAVQKQETPLVKIGFTKSPDVYDRIKTLRCPTREMLTLTGAVWIRQHVPKIEHYIHWLLRGSRVEGEWFAVAMNQVILEALATQAQEALNAHIAHAWCQPRRVVRIA